MALYKKNNPVGIDKEIAHLQDHIYAKLLGYGWSDYNCYGRAMVNKNPREDKQNTIEVDTDNKNYKEVLLDDKHIATSFFVLTKPVEYGELAKGYVSLIFQINLKKLFSGIKNRRPDEEAIMDIVEFLHVNPPSFKLVEVKMGVDDVYKDLGIVVNQRDNMSDFLVCRFDMTTTFIHHYECDYQLTN